MTFVLILFLASLVATALSAMSGGGSGIIAIPVMLALGIPYPLGLAAQKLGAIFWLVPAAHNYLGDRKVEWGFLIGFSALGLIGVYLGFLFVLSVDQRIVSIIVGILILVLVAYMLLRPNVGLRETEAPAKRMRLLAYVFAPLLGFYESFFGSGNGLLFSTLVLHTRRYDLLEALGYYFAVAFAWQVLSVGLLFAKGYFDWSVMVPTVLGSLAGGYLGSRYGKYMGKRFVTGMFICIGTILGLKLLIGL